MKRLAVVVGLLALLSSSTFADTNSYERLCRSLSCGDCGHWYLQAETLFFGSSGDLQNPAPSFQLTNAAPAATISPTASSFNSSGLAVSPRLTLGKQINDCWGIQFRYWDFRLRDGFGSNAPFPAVGTQPDLGIVAGNDSLHAYTLDLEATRCFCFRGHNVLGTLGVRHASLDHSQGLTAFGQTVGGDSFTLTSLNAIGMDGTGLTSSLFTTRPLQKNCCWSIYGGGRTSYLFGNSSGLAITSATVQTTTGSASSVNGALADGGDSMFVGEFQTGLQWSRCLRGCNAQAFLRGGFEYQYWNAGGDGILAAATSTAASTQGTATVVATTLDTSFDRHLIGFGLSAGFSW